jgi:hypothetical protein
MDVKAPLLVRTKPCSVKLGVKTKYVPPTAPAGLMLGGGAMAYIPGLMPPELSGESKLVKVPFFASTKPWTRAQVTNDVSHQAPAISPFGEIEPTYVEAEPGGSKVVMPPVGVRRKPCCTPLASV